MLETMTPLSKNLTRAFATATEGPLKTRLLVRRQRQPSPAYRSLLDTLADASRIEEGTDG